MEMDRLAVDENLSETKVESEDVSKQKRNLCQR
jgi:hypothetical protein